MRAARLPNCSKEREREDAAASIQSWSEDIVLAALTRDLYQQAPHRHLGLSGGLFANVKLNRHLADNLSLRRESLSFRRWAMKGFH